MQNRDFSIENAQNMHPVLRVLLEALINPEYVGFSFQLAQMAISKIRKEQNPAVSESPQVKSVFEKIINDCKHIGVYPPYPSINHCDSNERTPLIWAARRGDAAIMKLLLQKKADVTAQDKDGNTALIRASFSGHLPCVELLIAAKVGINHQNHNGGRAAINASHHGYNKILQLLIDNNANINLKDNPGNTALIWASYTGFDDNVNLLLERKAVVTHKNKHGADAFLYAASLGHEEIVDQLLAHGADPDVQDQFHRTAITFALEVKQTKTVKKLIDIGVPVKFPNDKKKGAADLAVELKDLNSLAAILRKEDAFIAKPYKLCKFLADFEDQTTEEVQFCLRMFYRRQKYLNENPSVRGPRLQRLHYQDLEHYVKTCETSYNKCRTNIKNITESLGLETALTFPVLDIVMDYAGGYLQYGLFKPRYGESPLTQMPPTTQQSQTCIIL